MSLRNTRKDEGLVHTIADQFFRLLAACLPSLLPLSTNDGIEALTANHSPQAFAIICSALKLQDMLRGELVSCDYYVYTSIPKETFREELLEPAPWIHAQRHTSSGFRQTLVLIPMSFGVRAEQIVNDNGLQGSSATSSAVREP